MRWENTGHKKRSQNCVCARACGCGIHANYNFRRPLGHIPLRFSMWKLLSRIRLFASPRIDSPWNSPGQNTGEGSLCLLQGIFPAQGSNPGLPHCGWILYQLSHQGSLITMLPCIPLPKRGTHLPCKNNKEKSQVNINKACVPKKHIHLFNKCSCLSNRGQAPKKTFLLSL